MLLWELTTQAERIRHVCAWHAGAAGPTFSKESLEKVGKEKEGKRESNGGNGVRLGSELVGLPTESLGELPAKGCGADWKAGSHVTSKRKPKIHKEAIHKKWDLPLEPKLHLISPVEESAGFLGSTTPGIWTTAKAGA